MSSPKSIQGGQTSPIMWLYNSKEDSYWIGLWMGEMVLTRDQDSLFGGKLFWKELSEDTDPSAPREKLISSNKRKYIWSRELLWSLSHRRNILIFAAALNISWAHHLWSDEIRSASRSRFQWRKELFSLQTTQFTDSRQNIWSGLAPTYRFKQEFFSQLHSQFPAQIEKVHNIIQ